MILSFKTKIENKPTYFVKKIVLGLERVGLISICKASELLSIPISEIRSLSEFSKLHTMREDKNNRWKSGNKIDFFINARQKDMFRFAPVLPVVSIQKVEMIWHDDKIKLVNIYIDGECYVQNYGIEFNSSNQRQERMEQLAKNDGFDSVEGFLNYFNTNFTGKIIHWTDFKYEF